eukprot:207333_1
MFSLILNHVLFYIYISNAQVSYINPVGDCNCPDPGAIYDVNTQMYYVGTTGSNGNNHFPLRESSDAAKWNQIGYIFNQTNTPNWAVSNGNFWAPEIHKINDKQYNVYFVAQDNKHNNILSVGVATSTKPYGPFKDPIGKPLVPGDTQTNIGNIDPNFFRDPATQKLYVIYKYNGNAKGQPTPIYMAELNDNGTQVIGNRIQLITDDKSWECYNNHCLIEAPWLIYNNITNYYYLFYSATGYGSPYYNIGVARSKTLDQTMKFQKFSGPILHTKWGSPYITDVNDTWAGPGHCSVLKYNNDDNRWIMIYHSWKSDAVNKGNRYMMLDPIQWINDWPRIFSDSPSQDTSSIPSAVQCGMILH